MSGATTWDELLGDGADSYLLIRLGQLLFVWPKESSFVKVIRCDGDPDQLAKAGSTMQVALEVEVPPSLRHDADAFVAFCQEFVGAPRTPLGALLDAIQGFAERQGGTLGLSFNSSESRTGRWSAALTFGQEAPDSPMAGGQALGIGESPAEVLRQVAEEAHIEVSGPDWATPTPDDLDAEDAKALIAYIDGDADGGVLDELGTIHKLRTLAESAGEEQV